jgi:hypothetical protein
MTQQEYNDFLNLPYKNQTEKLGIYNFKYGDKKQYGYQFVLYKPEIMDYKFPKNKIKLTYTNLLGSNIQDDTNIHTIGKRLDTIFFANFNEWTDVAIHYFNYAVINNDPNSIKTVGLKVTSVEYEYGNVGIRAYVYLEAKVGNNSVKVMGKASSKKGLRYATDIAIINAVVNLLNDSYFFKLVNSN